MSKKSLYERIGQLLGLKHSRNHSELPVEIPKVIELPKQPAPLPIEVPIYQDEKVEESVKIEKKLSFTEILEKNRKERNGNA